MGIAQLLDVECLIRGGGDPSPPPWPPPWPRLRPLPRWLARGIHSRERNRHSLLGSMVPISNNSTSSRLACAQGFRSLSSTFIPSTCLHYLASETAQTARASTLLLLPTMAQPNASDSEPLNVVIVGAGKNHAPSTRIAPAISLVANRSVIVRYWWINSCTGFAPARSSSFCT